MSGDALDPQCCELNRSSSWYSCVRRPQFDHGSLLSWFGAAPASRGSGCQSRGQSLSVTVIARASRDASGSYQSVLAARHCAHRAGAVFVFGPMIKCNSRPTGPLASAGSLPVRSKLSESPTEPGSQHELMPAPRVSSSLSAAVPTGLSSPSSGSTGAESCQWRLHPAGHASGQVGHLLEALACRQSARPQSRPPAPGPTALCWHLRSCVPRSWHLSLRLVGNRNACLLRHVRSGTRSKSMPPVAYASRPSADAGAA
jgi:hypothetical protein